MWLLILSPIFDNINGYFLLSGRNSNISVIFKTIIFLFCITMSFQFMTGNKMIGIVFLILIFAIQLIVFRIKYEGLAYDISSLIKLMTPIVIVMAVQTLKINDRTTAMCIDRVSRFYCWFFPISLMIPAFLNIGYATYSSGEGNKGFYYAGNEIAIIMVIVFALELEKYRSNKTKVNFLNIILGVISILYIGTKTGYIALIVFILAMLYSEKNINRKFLNAILIVPGTFLGLWYVINNVNAVTQSVHAIIWRYTTRLSKGVSFLLSGRELRIRRAFELVYSNNFIKNILIGIGTNVAENELDILIEMDLLDLFIRFGLIVSIVIISFYVKNVRQIIKGKRILYITGSLLACGASVFAGHMLFSPMVSMVLMILFLKNNFDTNMIEDNI